MVFIQREEKELNLVFSLEIQDRVIKVKFGVVWSFVIFVFLEKVQSYISIMSGGLLSYIF